MYSLLVLSIATKDPTTIIEEGAEKIQEEVTKEVHTISKFLSDKMPDFMEFGFKLLIAIVIFFVGRLLVKYLLKLLERTLSFRKADQGVQQFTNSFAYFILYAILFVGILSFMGVHSTTFAAVLASAGVGIGLAMQGTLSNLAGGLLILLYKPFVVGDYVKEDLNQNEGTVKQIQMFYTKLATPDNKTIIIPNSVFANNSMTNETARAERQMRLEFPVSHKTNLEVAKPLIYEIVKNQEGVKVEDGVDVVITDISRQQVTIRAMAWVATDDLYDIRWSVFEKIKNALDEKAPNWSDYPPVFGNPIDN